MDIKANTPNKDVMYSDVDAWEIIGRSGIGQWQAQGEASDCSKLHGTVRLAAAFCHDMRNRVGIFFVAVLLTLSAGLVRARDDGRYANSPLKSWFDNLRSGRGLCCSVADGLAISDPDWDSKDGHYRVRLDGEWIDVPDDAVIKEPNRAGRTMVWPIDSAFGKTIRCFLPGTMG